MPNYRCPICGANHKKLIPNCRLCGQNMSGEFIPTGPPPQATTSASMLVGNQGGTKGVFLLGAALVIVLVVAAVIFGVARSNSVVESGKNLFVKNADGWTPQSEPDDKQGPPATGASNDIGHFVVDLPGDRIHEEVPFSATKSGKITAWTAKVGKDTKIQVGWGKVTPPTPGAGPQGTSPDPGPTIRNFLKQISLAWAAQNALTDLTYKQSEASIAGQPAYLISSISPKFKLDGKDAFGWLGLTLKGDTLYVIQVLSIYGDAPQFDRVAGTLQITG